MYPRSCQGGDGIITDNRRVARATVLQEAAARRLPNKIVGNGLIKMDVY